MSISSIEWTDETWNPVTGCTRVSKGCDNCYAVRMTNRLGAMGKAKYKDLINHGKRHFNGVVRTHPETLRIPYHRKKPTKWFVNSMSDLFHRGIPEVFVVEVFDVMVQMPQHTYQILTKRPERMREIMPRVWENLAARHTDRDGCPTFPLPNVWLGTSVEDEAAAGRIEHLRKTPTHLRFLSCEPLLGPLRRMNLANIHWVIVGGESGHGARPMIIDWAVDIVDQCAAAGIACFVKQLGARPFIPAGGPDGNDLSIRLKNSKGGDPDEWPPALRVRKFPV